MNIKSQITQEDFENLLVKFAPDREEAGLRYEKVRQGLMRYFRFRGCDDPETLADETINRVAKKLTVLEQQETLKLVPYFYSFAARIYLEERKEKARKGALPLDELDPPAPQTSEQTERKERESRCLERCLAGLKAEDRALIVEYYSREKIEKLRLRAELAERLNVKLPALHTRVHRLRGSLRECLEKCLDANL